LRQAVDQFVRPLIALARGRVIWVGSACLVLIVAATAFTIHEWPNGKLLPTDVSSQSKRPSGRYQPTTVEWASLVIEPAELRSFRIEKTTEGKIAVDEDRSTPIFSPYSGRVTKLMVKPGEIIERGQPMFTIEATDAVQAQNDFIVALTSLNKAKAALHLAQINNKRQIDLYEGRATPLKDVQNASAALDTAENDVQSADVALQAARNRLRILGKSNEDIAEFQEKGSINPSTSIPAPITGTIVQRKVGPGQFIAAGASEPVFVIGDLSTVWLVAYVRESDAAKINVGQDISFTVSAYPDQAFSAKLGYVSAMVDPATRRLLVRATVNNPDGKLKPEMFANVVIFSDPRDRSVAIAREGLVYEGNLVRVWVVNSDNSIELRRIRTGLTSGRMIEVLEGLTAGERVVTKGSLLNDRASVGS
jgi:cobalt-zinc-cadmium efflux system membrane fusion protein